MGAYVGGKKILDLSRATIRGNADFNGGNLTDVGTLQGTTIIAGAKSVVGYQNYVEADPAILVASKDVERKFFKDDFSVDSSENYVELVESSSIYDTNHLVLGAGKAIQLTDGDVTPNKFSIKIKQTGLPSTMSNGTNQFHIRFTGIPMFKSNYRDGDLVIVIYNGGAETKLLVCDIYQGNLNKGVSNAFATTEDYLAFLHTTWTIECEFLSDGKLKITIPELSRTVTSTWIPSLDNAVRPYIVAQSNLRSPLEIYEITSSPSISYADDFSTDTTERYQAVTGTVAYDDTNKRMNVTTASGANGKASGRLKSYKFCEGSQIYDVLLPTGADGDFICLATHSANGLMTDGIGVGLQSDGAGNWNLATLSGTTVTEGASSGLTDSKTARIEIEKDITGAYWYYIYDAAGTKPTTATGKLFTTRTEGYTGWYANGNSKTYAIDNISIRAESIVGRTNVEVTEPFWFEDEFGENSIGRYPHSPTWSISNGTLIRSAISANPIWFTNTQISNFDVTFDFKPQLTDNTDPNRKFWFVFGSNRNKIEGYNNGIRYLLNLSCRTSSTTCRLDKFDGTLQSNLHSFGSTTDILEGQEGFTSVRILLVNGALSLYINGVQLGTTYNIGENVVGYIGAYGWGVTDVYEIDNLQISGTRVYQKPIHRGAMAETVMLDGIETVATTIAYDFNWDCIGEFSGVSSSSVDVVNGRLTLADTDYIYPTGHSAGLGYYQYRIMRSAASGSIELYVAGNVISITNAGAVSFNGGAAESYTIAVTAETLVAFDVGATSIAVYADGVLKGTKTGLTITSSNPKMKRTTADFYVSQMIVVALSPDAIDGFAPSLAGVGGGARFDAVEYIQSTLVNAAKYGKYLLSACCKTTDSDAEAAELYFKNSTDNTDITSDASDTETIALADTNYADFTKDLVLNYDDIDDTVDLRVRRTTATTHNQPPVYVRHLALTPRVEVG